MTTKAKKAPDQDNPIEDTRPDSGPVLYDAGSRQSIPLSVETGRGPVTVRHELLPLNDVRYFALQAELERVTARLKKVTTEIYKPKDSLWGEIVEAVDGYKPRAGDFRDGVPQSHRCEAINALLEVQLLDPPADDEPEYFDIDAAVVVPFAAMQSGVLLTDLSLTFRPESKAEMDAFLALEANLPNPNQLASSVKRSRHERLCELGRPLLLDRAGYADNSEVPAWHLAPAVEAFFLRQISAAGKILA